MALIWLGSVPRGQMRRSPIPVINSNRPAGRRKREYNGSKRHRVPLTKQFRPAAYSRKIPGKRFDNAQIS